MTEVGAGGVVVQGWSATPTYQRKYRKLTSDLQGRVDKKLDDLQKNPRPPGLDFEKLKGYQNPDIYTIHITGNYKLSFELNGATALLRKVGTHDEIDRAP